MHRLPGDHQSVVGHGVEGHAVRGEHGVLIIALFELEAEIDFVARRIAEAHARRAGRAASARRQAGFDRRRGAGVVTGGEGGFWRRFALRQNRAEPASAGRAGGFGSGELARSRSALVSMPSNSGGFVLAAI